MITKPHSIIFYLANKPGFCLLKPMPLVICEAFRVLWKMPIAGCIGDTLEHPLQSISTVKRNSIGRLTPCQY